MLFRSERERKLRAIQSPRAPRGTANSEREREASDAAEVDAAIDLMNGDDSQHLEDMDVDTPRSTRSQSKKAAGKAGASKKTPRSRKKEQDEESNIRDPKGRGKAAPSRSSRRISSPDTNFGEEEEEEEEDPATRPGPSRIANGSPSKAVRGRILDSDD